MTRSSLLRRSLVLGVLGVFALAGCGSNSTGGAAASVGSAQVSVAQFQSELRVLRDNPFLKDQVAANGVLLPEVVAGFLQRDVYELVIDQLFVERNLSVSPAQLQTARTQLISQFATQTDPTGAKVFGAFPKAYQDDLVRRQARTNAVVATFVPVDAKTYLERNKAEFVAQCASGKIVRHIAVATEADANDITAQLDRGVPFADLAGRSLDTQTGAQGGYVGCYEPGQFAPVYENVVKNLAPGQRTVLRTAAGYDIIEVNGLTADSLKSVIDAQQQQAALSALTDVLNERLAKNRPVVNPRFGVVVFDANGLRINPVGSTDSSAGGISAPRIRTMPAPTTQPLTSLIPGQ